MTTQAQGDDKGGTNANVSPDPAGKTPAGSSGNEETTPKKIPVVNTGASPKAPTGDDKKTEKKKHTIASADDDDDIPDDAELIELSPKALKARLARHTRRELQQRFGTDDIERVEKDLKELAELRSEREEQRKAQLTKEQRLAEEKKAAEKRAKDAEDRAKALEDERDVGTVSSKFTKIAAKYMDANVLEDEDLRPGFFKKLAKHLHGETNGKYDRITDKMVDDFFKNFAHDNPKYAKTGGGETIEVPINSGTGARAPAGGQNAPSGQGAAKTAKPGQANSMSREEIRKTYGLRW